VKPFTVKGFIIFLTVRPSYKPVIVFYPLPPADIEQQSGFAAVKTSFLQHCKKAFCIFNTMHDPGEQLCTIFQKAFPACVLLDNIKHCSNVAQPGLAEPSSGRVQPFFRGFGQIEILYTLTLKK